MDKKDIYEHLAKIYLDASSKRKKKSRDYPKLFKNLFFASSAVIVGLGIFIFGFFLNKAPSNDSEIALVIQHDPVKINFNFNPAKKEIFSISLNNLDAIRFKTLAFQVKKINYYNNISLRVEFINAFKEKSEVYIKNIGYRWNEYRIDLADFKNISDWTRMTNLAFIVEEWNTKEKDGIVYLDNIRLLR